MKVRTLLTAVWGLSMAVTGSAADFFVTSQIRDVPMKAGEPVLRDYYVNAGTNNGLRKGVYIDAIRKLPVFDNINSRVLGDVPVHVARLRIIHADKTVSVARLVKFFDKEATPIAGFDAVMIGDFIEVSEKQ